MNESDRHVTRFFRNLVGKEELARVEIC